MDKDTFEYIGDFAFFGTRITSFTGGRNLKVIGKNAFMRCRALKMVDLMDTAIKNQVDRDTGAINREILVSQYKYDYELEKKDNKDPKDYLNALADGAFQGCIALNWVSLPRNLQQVSNALFANCKGLRTVIIPCSISSDAYSPSDPSTLAQTNLAAFYYRNLPAAIYDSEAVPYMKIYVPQSQLSAHQAIYPPATGQDRYRLLDEDNLPEKP